MASQTHNPESASGKNTTPSGTVTRRLVLPLFRWIVTTNWFLFLLAALLVGGSLLLSLYTGAWHWFQRSGALTVSIGAVLSTRRPLRLMLESLIGDEGPNGRYKASKLPPFSDPAELRTCLCGFALVAMGTLIWAYGDLIGCLAYWNAECLR